MKQAILFLALFLLTVTGTIFGTAPLEIDGIYPDSAVPGTTVIVKGHGFSLGNQEFVWASNIGKGACPGFIEFNGARGEVLLWQDNLIMVRVPRHANSGAIRLTLSSGLSLQGNHFEVLQAQPEEGQTPLRKYAFEQNNEMTYGDLLAFNQRGFYPSPHYFYSGYRPSLYNNQRWGHHRWGGHGGWRAEDGGLDFFLVSGPLLRNCGLYTGLDNFLFFPTGFYQDFQSRFDWWNQNISHHRIGDQNQERNKYRFEE